MISALSAEAYVNGVIAGDRAVLGRAISLVESTLDAHRALADDVLRQLMPHAGKSARVGISGVPGVGKSTFIEALGMHLVEAGSRVAVLAVDPSSARSGGSILGDKTRMARLSNHDSAFIRPSPSRGTLGGVTDTSRETVLVCEAAGFDVVIVETVGIGQSEAAVRDLVDTFLLLSLAGAGDELQGIKRGVLELVDLIAINKADGDNVVLAKQAKAECQSALRLLRGGESWTPSVLLTSAIEGTGIAETWQGILAHQKHLDATSMRETRRTEQLVRWMHQTFERGLLERIARSPKAQAALKAAEAAVRSKTHAPRTAAEEVLNAVLDAGNDS